MPCLRRLIVSCLMFIAVTVQAQLYEAATVYPHSAFAEMKLKNGKTGKPADLGISSHNSRYFVFVFLSPECPLSQQYTLSLNNLAKDYQQEVAVIGIFPGKSYDHKTIHSFLQKYKISFPTFIDEEKQLSNYLKASVTPEVILLGKETNTLTVQYRGAIDDRVKSLGVKRLKASNYFLQDAIKQSLQQQDVVIKRTDPVGCLINDY